MTVTCSLILSGVTITNFPEELIKGDSYDIDTGQIRINLKNSIGEYVNVLGSLDIADAEITFVMFRPNDSAYLYGECVYEESGSEYYLLLTLRSTVTQNALTEYTYEGRLQLEWTNSSGSGDVVQRKSYKTTPFKFVINPIES